MPVTPNEWLQQADYDMETAEYMFSGGRAFYAVFMPHLSVEKALKGLYLKKLQTVPPKTHNLILLLKETGSSPGEDMHKFIIRLNEASVTTRYPEDLRQLIEHFDNETVKKILSQGKEFLKWIKSQF